MPTSDTTHNSPHSTPDTEDLLLSSYDYALPENLIAQQPALSRTDSRLMVLDSQSQGPHIDVFSNLLHHLPEDCLLIANNSRVIPARLTGRRASGGKAEFLLLTPLPLLCAAPATGEHLTGWFQAEAEGLLRASKKNCRR